MSRLENEVRALLCGALELQSLDGVEAADDLQYAGMDSLNCMSLIVDIEERFGILIPDDKLGLRSVRNIYDICKLIEGVRGNG